MHPSGWEHGLFRGSSRDRINDWANLIQLLGAFAFIGSCVQAQVAAVDHSPAAAPGWQLNFVGSVLFMAGSCFAVAATVNDSSALAQVYGYSTAAGAVGFAVGAYLGLRAANIPTHGIHNPR